MRDLMEEPRKAIDDAIPTKMEHSSGRALERISDKMLDILVAEQEAEVEAGSLLGWIAHFSFQVISRSSWFGRYSK